MGIKRHILFINQKRKTNMSEAKSVSEAFGYANELKNNKIKWPVIDAFDKKGNDMVIGTAYLTRYPAYFYEEYGVNISSSIYFEYNYKEDTFHLWMVDAKTHAEFDRTYKKDVFMQDAAIYQLKKLIVKKTKKVQAEEQ